MSSGTDTQRVPVGKCPEHDYVWGDYVEYNFPNPSVCTRHGCGSEMESVTTATKSEVMNIVE